MQRIHLMDIGAATVIGTLGVTIAYSAGLGRGEPGLDIRLWSETSESREIREAAVEIGRRAIESGLAKPEEYVEGTDPMFYNPGEFVVSREIPHPDLPDTTLVYIGIVEIDHEELQQFREGHPIDEVERVFWRQLAVDEISPVLNAETEYRYRGAGEWVKNQGLAPEYAPEDIWDILLDPDVPSQQP